MTDVLNGIQVLPPWQIADGPKDGLVDELRREVGPGHALYGKVVRVLALSGDGDDVLFAVDSPTISYAVVHLTWRGSQEPSPTWPHVELYPTLEAWRIQRMDPDHAEYVATDEGR